MFGKHKGTDVLVVGAGPVGMITALFLHEHGARVEIIDEQIGPGAHSYALALHPRSLEVLREVGLAREAMRRGYAVRSIALYDGSERRAELSVGAVGGEDPIVLVLRQDVLETLLEGRLKERGVPVQWTHRLTGLTPTDDQVQATVHVLDHVSLGYAIGRMEWLVKKQFQTAASFVIGADGWRSSVRQHLGATFDAVDDPQCFAVFEFQTDLDLHHEMRLVLHGDSVSVLWPMADGFCRWSFQIPEADFEPASRTKSRLAVQVADEAYPFLTREYLRGLLEQRAPWFEGSVGEICWSAAVRFERRLTSCFGRGRVWLAGDAAHMAGPVGAQSMNVGLLEGRQLAAAIGPALRAGGVPESLESYDRERLREWRWLLGVEGELSTLPGCDPWVADNARRILSCLPASGEQLVRLLAELRLRPAE